MATTDKQPLQGLKPVAFSIQLARLAAEISFCLFKDKKQFNTIMQTDGVDIIVKSQLTGPILSDISTNIKLYEDVKVTMSGSSDGIFIYLRRSPQPPLD